MTSNFLDYSRKELMERKGEEADNDTKKVKSNFSLKDNIEAAWGKMAKDAINDPANKKIPPGFDEFTKSDQYRELL